MMTGKEFYELLRSSTADKGNQALEAVAQLILSDDDPQITMPSIAALLCWGDRGLERIKSLALESESVSVIASAMRALATAAAGADIRQSMLAIHDDQVVSTINSTIATSDLSAAARIRLSEIVLSIPTDDLLIPLGLSFTTIGMGNSELAKELFLPLTVKWLKFSPIVIDELETLLRDNPSDEPALHTFLLRYPQILEPMAVQVWSKPDFHGHREPDFLIRRSDDTYLVIEIENATKPIVTQSGQLSSQTTQAISQANSYRGFLSERIQEARLHFPNFRDPDALVVVGMESTLDTSQALALKQDNESRDKLRIVGFDWLVARSRIILSNLSTPGISVAEGYRVI